MKALWLVASFIEYHYQTDLEDIKVCFALSINIFLLPFSINAHNVY